MFPRINELPIAAASEAGQIFRMALPFALLLGLAVILIHFVVTRLGPQPTNARTPWRWWESLVYLAVVAIVGYLGFTSFAAMLLNGAIGGWWLFAHMFGAGAMVAALPVLALMWADANRFALGSDHDPAAPVKFLGLTKIAFWLILVSGLIVSATMIFSMLTWLGTSGQLLMLDLHRYAGLVCVLAVWLHLYGAALLRLRGKAR